MMTWYDRQFAARALRRASVFSSVGALAGLGASILLGPALSSRLFGQSPDDRLTLASVPLVLVAIAMLTGWVRALRATRVDPLVALRTD